MPRNAQPRKAYRPRLINAPITAGLVDMFTECLMTAETGLHLRADTTDHYDAIAAVLNVIGPVALRRWIPEPGRDRHPVGRFGDERRRRSRGRGQWPDV